MSSSSFLSPWPDPNSPVLSKIDFGVPLPDLLLWLKVRDTLLSWNYVMQDVAAALALAKTCKHPDAVWISSIFEGRNVSTKKKAKNVFLSHQDDARALCFAWLLDGRDPDKLHLLERSAEMGYAFAHTTLCEEFQGDKQRTLILATAAAAQHERDGFNWLGQLLNSSENHLIAAELGHVSSAETCIALLDASDPAHLLWCIRIKTHQPRRLLTSFRKHVSRFFAGFSGNAFFVFIIGRALKGKINVQSREILGCRFGDFDSVIGPANQAVSFYDQQIKAARLAVDAWTLLATRFKICKDIRRLIGRLIWEGRSEANYTFNLEDGASSPKKGFDSDEEE